MRSCRLIVLLILATAVAGCFTVTASTSLTRKELTDKADVARSTATTMADVHRILGEPWLSSERFRVEVYRKTGSYRELLVAFGLLPFPIPAPIPLPKEGLTGYTLVSYSADGVVEAVDTALSKYPDLPLAHMQAGDFAFTERVPPPGAPSGTALQSLIVSHERFTSGVQGQACTLLVGCSGMCRTGISPVEMQLDGDSSTKYLLGFSLPLVPLTPATGAHTLRISAGGQAGDMSTEFTCPASELRYVITTAHVRTSFPAEHLFWPSSRLEGTVEIQSGAPAELKESGVLLWTHGRWLGER